MTPSLNASTAKILIAQSPAHAWTAHPELNPNFREDHDRTFDVGNAAHAALWTGGGNIVVVDAADWRTKAAKEARDAAILAGKLPLLPSQESRVRAMVEIARKAWADCPDLEGYAIEDGEAERRIEWMADAAPVRGDVVAGALPMHGTPDWRSKDRRLIVDYKTTAGSARPDHWTRTALDQGADLQAAFYLWGNAALGGPEASDPNAHFVFLVQETEEPFAVSFVGVDPAMRDLGLWKVSKAVKTWAACIHSGKWHGYPNRIVDADLPPWAFKEMEAE